MGSLNETAEQLKTVRLTFSIRGIKSGREHDSKPGQVPKRPWERAQPLNKGRWERIYCMQMYHNVDQRYLQFLLR